MKSLRPKMVISLLLVATCAGMIPPLLERAGRGGTESYLVARLQRVQDLDQAELYEEALEETNKLMPLAERHGLDAEVLYLQWATLRHLRRREESEGLAKSLARRFPRHRLLANVRFCGAQELLQHGKYAEADFELKTIMREFPDSPIIGDVRSLHIILQGRASERQSG